MRKFLFATMIVAVLAGCQTTPSTDTGAPIDDKTAAPNTGATTSGAGDGRVTGITTGSGTGSNMDILRGRRRCRVCSCKRGRPAKGVKQGRMR